MRCWWLQKIRVMVADLRGFHKDYLEGTTSIADIAEKIAKGKRK